MAKRSRIQAEGRQIARIAREGVQACMEDMGFGAKATAVASEPKEPKCYVDGRFVGFYAGRIDGDGDVFTIDADGEILATYSPDRVEFR